MDHTSPVLSSDRPLLNRFCRYVGVGFLRISYILGLNALTAGSSLVLMGMFLSKDSTKMFERDPEYWVLYGFLANLSFATLGLLAAQIIHWYLLAYARPIHVSKTEAAKPLKNTIVGYLRKKKRMSSYEWLEAVLKLSLDELSEKWSVRQNKASIEVFSSHQRQNSVTLDFHTQSEKKEITFSNFFEVYKDSTPFVHAWMMWFPLLLEPLRLLIRVMQVFYFMTVDGIHEKLSNNKQKTNEVLNVLMGLLKSGVATQLEVVDRLLIGAPRWFLIKLFFQPYTHYRVVLPAIKRAQQQAKVLTTDFVNKSFECYEVKNFQNVMRESKENVDDNNKELILSALTCLHAIKNILLTSITANQFKIILARDSKLQQSFVQLMQGIFPLASKNQDNIVGKFILFLQGGGKGRSKNAEVLRKELIFLLELVPPSFKKTGETKISRLMNVLKLRHSKLPLKQKRSSGNRSSVTLEEMDRLIGRALENVNKFNQQEYVCINSIRLDELHAAIKPLTRVVQFKEKLLLQGKVQTNYINLLKSIFFTCESVANTSNTNEALIAKSNTATLIDAYYYPDNVDLQGVIIGDVDDEQSVASSQRTRHTSTRSLSDHEGDGDDVKFEVAKIKLLGVFHYLLNQISDEKIKQDSFLSSLTVLKIKLPPFSRYSSRSSSRRRSRLSSQSVWSQTTRSCGSDCGSQNGLISQYSSSGPG